MVIYFLDNKLKRGFEEDAERKKRFGMEMANKIKLRMESLLAAKSLADFLPPYSGPERCHELNGILKGIFSINLKHPYRLLVKPTENQQREIYNLQDWGNIDEVILVGIEDTND